MTQKLDIEAQIAFEQSGLLADIRDRSALGKGIEIFLENYEKSNHYKALESHEHEDYLDFKRLIKEALRNTRYDPPAELIHITIENYMLDYIRDEIDIYS